MDNTYIIYSSDGKQIGAAQDVTLDANDYDGEQSIVGSFRRAILRMSYDEFLNVIDKGGIIIEKINTETREVIYTAKTNMLMFNKDDIIEQTGGFMDGAKTLIIDKRISFFVTSYEGEPLEYKKIVTYYDSEKGGWTEESKEFFID